MLHTFSNEMASLKKMVARDWSSTSSLKQGTNEMASLKACQERKEGREGYQWRKDGRNKGQKDP